MYIQIQLEAQMQQVKKKCQKVSQNTKHTFPYSLNDYDALKSI